MLATIFRLLHIITYLILSVIYEVETIIISVLQMRGTEAQYAGLVVEPQCSSPRSSVSRVQILNCHGIYSLYKAIQNSQVCLYMCSVYILCKHIHIHVYSLIIYVRIYMYSVIKCISICPCDKYERI